MLIDSHAHIHLANFDRDREQVFARARQGGIRAIINIGLEGIMMTSAFSGVAVSHYTGNPWLGVLAAVAVGGLLGLFHAVLTVKFAGDQIVSGTGINIFAMGFTAYMSQIIWGSRGASDSVTGIKAVTIPLLRQVPILGAILGKHSPLVYIMLAVTVISYIVASARSTVTIGSTTSLPSATASSPGIRA